MCIVLWPKSQLTLIHFSLVFKPPSISVHLVKLCHIRNDRLGISLSFFLLSKSWLEEYSISSSSRVVQNSFLVLLLLVHWDQVWWPSLEDSKHHFAPWSFKTCFYTPIDFFTLDNYGVEAACKNFNWNLWFKKFRNHSLKIIFGAYL